MFLFEQLIKTIDQQRWRERESFISFTKIEKFSSLFRKIHRNTRIHTGILFVILV